MTTLTGMTWRHPRGHDSLLAATAAFSAERPDVDVTWDARSLQDFADFPLSDLADRYDLLVVDHPFVGEAAASGLLVPLDTVLSSGFLDDQRRHSVGPSWRSYEWDGHQWALAIDAACHVSVTRSDLVPEPPRDWAEVLRLARALQVRGRSAVAVPAKPIDAYLALVTLVANDIGDPFREDGALADPRRTVAALEFLAELLALCHPASLRSNPIELLELMTSTDEVAYMPITFGYVTYATPGARAHAVSFGPIPLGTRGSDGGALGGAGLGVSARSERIPEAVAFARFVASGSVQGGAYVSGGGQPGYRSAWLDPAVNRCSGGFFAATLGGIDGSYLRPRWPGYLPAQTVAAEMVHAWLSRRDVPASGLVRALDTHFVKAHGAAVARTGGGGSGSGSIKVKRER